LCAQARGGHLDGGEESDRSNPAGPQQGYVILFPVPFEVEGVPGRRRGGRVAMAQEVASLAIPEEVKSHPTWYRLNDQLDWYDRKSVSNQRWYRRIQGAQLILAAAIPVVAFLPVDGTKLATAVLGALVAILAGLQQLGQFHNNWTSYRSTAEQLKHEKYLFLAASGPYRNLETADALKLLSERVEELISTEHAKWVSDTRKVEGAQGNTRR
jgi:hypothetical protein